MKPTKKAKKSIRSEESLRTFNFESGKHLVTLKKVIYDDGSYSFITREESIPFFQSSKFQERLIVFCKQYKSLLENAALKESHSALTKSLHKFLSDIQTEYNARGRDQVKGIHEWTSSTYGIDFAKPKAESKSQAKPKVKSKSKAKAKKAPGIQETVKE